LYSNIVIACYYEVGQLTVDILSKRQMKCKMISGCWGRSAHPSVI